MTFTLEIEEESRCSDPRFKGKMTEAQRGQESRSRPHSCSRRVKAVTSAEPDRHRGVRPFTQAPADRSPADSVASGTSVNLYELLSHGEMKLKASISRGHQENPGGWSAGSATKSVC